MKNFLVTSLSLLLMAFLVIPSLAQNTEDRSVGSFHAIKSSQGISVYLHKGNSPAVRIEADGIDMDDIRTEVEGGVLKISLASGKHRNVNVKVDVTYTNLDMIAASSASGVFGNDVIRGSKMEIMASSAASVELELDVQEVMVNVSSAADVELSGKSQSASIDVSSAGEVDAYDLQVQQLRVMASSAGEAKVHAVQEISAMAGSGGSIRYKGDPQRSSTDSRSGGSVRKTN